MLKEEESKGRHRREEMERNELLRIHFKNVFLPVNDRNKSAL